MTNFDKFFEAFIECALWCSRNINNGENDDSSLERQGYLMKDFNPVSLEKLRKDCQSFFDENEEYISSDFKRAGHDFMLTRNGHGAGFWDGDWEDDIGEILTDRSHAYGETNFYVSDGVIFCD